MSDHDALIEAAAVRAHTAWTLSSESGHALWIEIARAALSAPPTDPEARREEAERAMIEHSAVDTNEGWVCVCGSEQERVAHLASVVVAALGAAPIGDETVERAATEPICGARYNGNTCTYPPGHRAVLHPDWPIRWLHGDQRTKACWGQADHDPSENRPARLSGEGETNA